MKRRKLLIPVFILGICMLSACGESSPKEEQIQQDLNTEIVNYRPFLTVDSYTIERSLTEEDTYSATITVTATSKYAQFDMQAEVDYVKFDQGWDMTDCMWSEQGYTIVEYPDTATMNELVNSNEELLTQKLDAQTCTEVSGSGESLRCTGTIDREMNPYLIQKGEVTTTWYYDVQNDSWIMSEDEVEADIQYQLQNAEGVWPSTQGGTTMTISNITETGLDISSETYGTQLIHVEKVEEPVFGCIEYKGTPGTEFTFVYGDEIQTAKSEDVTVYVDKLGEKGIRVWFYIRMFYCDIIELV